MNWYLFGVCGLAISALLASFFTAMCRHNSQQEPKQPEQQERYEDFH